MSSHTIHEQISRQVVSNGYIGRGPELEFKP